MKKIIVWLKSVVWKVLDFYPNNFKFCGVKKNYIHSGIYIFCKLLKILQFFLLEPVIPETSPMTITQSIEILSAKPELVTILVTTSLVLSLNFAINSVNFSLVFAKWNSTLFLKQACISASLWSPISIPVTYSVLTNFPKNVLRASFCRTHVFPHSILPTTNLFPRNWSS